MSTTLKQIIYDIRNTRYGGIANDDYTISDRQITYWINIERAKLIKEFVQKKRSIPETIIQDLGCVKVECVDPIECCNLGFSSTTTLYRTKKLPEPIVLNSSYISTPLGIDTVRLIDKSKTIPLVTKHQAQYKQHDKWTKHLPFAYYENGYIYIVNLPRLKYINITGAFEDPTEIEKYSTCEGEPCYNPDTSPYPIIPSHISILTKLILQERLGFILQPQVQPDTTNDTRDNPKPSDVQQPI